MFDGDWAPGLFLGVGVPRGVEKLIPLRFQHGKSGTNEKMAPSKPFNPYFQRLDRKLSLIRPQGITGESQVDPIVPVTREKIEKSKVEKSFFLLNFSWIFRFHLFGACYTDINMGSSMGNVYVNPHRANPQHPRHRSETPAAVGQLCGLQDVHMPGWTKNCEIQFLSFLDKKGKTLQFSRKPLKIIESCVSKSCVLYIFRQEALFDPKNIGDEPSSWQRSSDISLIFAANIIAIAGVTKLLLHQMMNICNLNDIVFRYYRKFYQIPFPFISQPHLSSLNS
jgi:hypothetical protein